MFKNPIIYFINQEISAERERSMQLCLCHKQTKLRSIPIWNPVSLNSSPGLLLHHAGRVEQQSWKAGEAHQGRDAGGQQVRMRGSHFRYTCNFGTCLFRYTCHFRYTCLFSIRKKHAFSQEKWAHKVLTYVECRDFSGVFQNSDPPPPSSPSECVLPPHQRGGGHTLAGRWGGGRSIFWKTPDIGLASYTIISLRWRAFQNKVQVQCCRFFFHVICQIPNLFCFKGGRSANRSAKSQNLRNLCFRFANVVICEFVICGPKFLDDLRICG